MSRRPEPGGALSSDILIKLGNFRMTAVTVSRPTVSLTIGPRISDEPRPITVLTTAASVTVNRDGMRGPAGQRGPEGPPGPPGSIRRDAVADDLASSICSQLGLKPGALAD